MSQTSPSTPAEKIVIEFSIVSQRSTAATGAPHVVALRRRRTSRVDARAPGAHNSTMSTLAEIEQAAEKLTPQQKQELMLFLGARLRTEGARLPGPRRFSREQVQSWIADDEAELKRFREQT